MYSVYNFFHRRQLANNVAVFKKLGLAKKYYSPLSSSDFAGLPAAYSTTGTDRQKLLSSRLFAKLDESSKESLLSFDENGYAILRSFLSTEDVDAINEEIAFLLQQKKIRFTNGNKLMFAIHSSALLRGVGNNAELKEVLAALLGGEPLLFQSINFLTGSQQRTHSDSIHMTTYPLGGLLGVWFALEDITHENGPLHYYPESHKLPYYLNADFQNEGNRWFLGDKPYTVYEDMIRQKIAEQHLSKQTFLANKGDVLIWHANLFHGGEPHLNKEKTRKSMVLHYFKKGAVCYHEITQRPALIKIFS